LFGSKFEEDLVLDQKIERVVDAKTFDEKLGMKIFDNLVEKFATFCLSAFIAWLVLD
jgi:hypothetical protein